MISSNDQKYTEQRRFTGSQRGQQHAGELTPTFIMWGNLEKKKCTDFEQRRLKLRANIKLQMLIH